MEDVQEDPAVLEIRVVNMHWIARRQTRVFIDEYPVGRLKGDRVVSFVVSAGSHKVRLKRRLNRSETLEVSLSPGERLALEGGFRRPPRLSKVLLELAFQLAQLFGLGGIALLLAINGLILTAIPIWMIFLVVQYKDLWMMCFPKPGALLYLKDPSDPVPAATRATRLPRLTIRRLMLLVAFLAVMLGIAAHERTEQRRHWYRSLAKIHADQERVWKGLVQPQLLTAPGRFESFALRIATYHERLKQKYLDAAADPRKPVEEDPPYPGP